MNSHIAPAEALEAKWQAVVELAESKHSASRAFSVALMGAEAYYWDPALLDTLRDSADSLPLDTTFSPSVFPTKSGWLWFGTRSSIICWDRDKDGSEKEYPLAALSWVEHEGHVVMGTWFAEGTKCFFKDGMSWPAETTLGSMTLRNNSLIGMLSPPNDEDGDPELDNYCGKMCALLMAAMLWINQSIVRAEPTHIERHVRRRLDRVTDLDFNRALLVVRLRRIENARQRETVAQEWSCRWIVSGHWRQQYHPSTGERLPRWIVPYVKGPDDKPLKPPGERVFAVIR